MEPIFGLGITPPDKWGAYGSSNVFQYEGMTADEYAAAHAGGDKKRGELLQEFWGYRDAAVNETAMTINHLQAQDNQNVRRLHGIEMQSLMRNTDTANAEALLQVQGASEQWKKLDRVLSGRGGTVLGYDIETFGDTSGRNGIFGITEVGIGKTEVGTNGVLKQSGFSLVIGLDKTETDYAMGLLNRFKTNGWDSLQEYEQVALKRMSMYGGDASARNFKSVFSKQIISELGGGEYYVVNNLVSADMMPDQIERGIKFLSDVYQDGATREKVFRPALDYLYSMHEPNTSSMGSVLTAANSKFDTGTMARYAEMHGISTTAVNSKGKPADIIETLKHDTVDLVYGARTAASVRNISVAEYQEQFHGTRGGGASVQSLLYSTGLNETETHLAISDINQQIKLLAAKSHHADPLNPSSDSTLVHDIVQHLDTGSKKGYLKFDGSDKAVIKRYDAKNSVFLLNRGWLDKTSGKDIALIPVPTLNDKNEVIGTEYAATQNYTVSGEYWELDTERTGYANDQYVLSLRSTADGTIVSKQFDTVEDMGNFLRNNADWFERNEIINSKGKHQEIHSDQQALVKYQDRGRREFERAIDPSSVSLESGKPSGGFAAMEEYLAWDKQYGGKFTGDPTGFHQFVEEAKKQKAFNPNKANSMQAYLGMQEKIAQENTLLNSIVDQINKSMPNADNMTKTIALRKAYTSAIDTMKGKAKLKSTAKHRNLIANDIFGVDVDMSKIEEGSTRISRINTHSVDTATRDVSRIFSGLTKEQAQTVIQDFGERGILMADQTERFSKLIREVGIDAGGDSKKAYQIGKYLNTESSYQLYTDIAYALHDATKVETDNNVIVKGKKARRAQSPKFTLESLSENLYAQSHLTFRGGKNVNAMYGISEMQSAVDRSVAQSISSTPRVTYFDHNNEGLRKQLQSLGEKLNYGDDITFKWVDKAGQEHTESFLEQMFFGGTWSDNRTFTPKGYNISQHKGLHTFVVQPDKNGSAYMLFTNDKNYGRLMDSLANTDLSEVDSFSAMRKTAISKYAGIYELPNIQRYTIEDKISDAMKTLIGRDTIDLTVLKQSANSEKFLVNSLNVYADEYGKVNAYVNNGVYDYLTAWRMGGKRGLEQVLDGDFEGFTSGMRRHQNAKLQPLSGSSSYRGYMTESGKVVRMANYGPGDYLYAYQMKMTEGLHSIFKHGLSNNAGSQANDLDRMVDAFVEEFGEGFNPKKEGLRHFRQRIADQSYFQEFFNKNLFLGAISDKTTGDSVIRAAYGDEYATRNLFNVILETVKKDTTGLFNDNVVEALEKINGVYGKETINQVLSSTAMEKGLVSLGIKPGEYDVNAFLYSTMRPTYLQQNLGRSFNPNEEWNMDLDGNALQVDQMGKVKLKDDSQIRILKTIAGSPEITVKEYIGQQAINAMVPGHANQVRHVMTGFKQMNDYDLQMKYKYMSENATTIANNLGMSVDQYRQYLAYMREDMLSVNEGKWFMDPLLGEQRFIRTNDAKKVFGFHVDDMDKATRERTEAQLRSLEGKLLTQTDVIGYSNTGKAIYYSGPEAILTNANIKELMKDGHTRVIPKVADIVDAKVMFNGSEKATAHAISVDSFLKYADAHGIAHGSRKETTLALSRIFNVLSDEAGFIGTQELEKHTNLSGIDSLWRTITTAYTQDGKGQILVNYLNNEVKNSPEFAGIKEFRFQDGVIISETSRAENPVAFIQKTWNDLQMNQFGNKELNERIVQQVSWMKSKNILYGAMQFQNQNEHVSDGIGIDKRMEQGIRERILSIKDGGERWDLKWADELRDYSREYNGVSSNKGGSYRNVQKVYDYFNKQINVGRFANMEKRRNMERGLHGIIESLIYYNAPEKYNVADANIVRLNFQELMASGIVPKNGVSVDTLHSTLFFEDGKPSEMLSRLAKQQNKHFGGKKTTSHSLYVDLGQYSIKAADGKTALNGFLVPIQTAITGADTTMFQTQQKIIAASLSKIENTIKNPGQRTTEQLSQELSDIVGKMYKDLFEQLAVQNKDSDLYKIIQRQVMPNSGGLLAEQEVGPLLTELTDDDAFTKAVDARNDLEAKIAEQKGKISEADIKSLNEYYTTIKEKSEALATRIRGVKDDNGNWIKRPEVFNFTALKGTGLEGIEKEILADGTSKYSFVAATSRKALEDQGLNFGKFGMDILFDYEVNAGKNIPTIRTDSGVKQLYDPNQLAAIRKRIMDSINADKGIGINITSTDTMVTEINQWLGGKYIKTSNNGKRLDIDTETLNKDMVNNGPLTRLFKHFDSVGEDYMKNIGVVGELVRYPTFRSQLASRMILSDHVQGNQVIMFNPITSSLTNVDFDGDLMYSIFKFDNGVPFLLNSKTYDISRNVYESGLDHIPDLLANLVEDGDAFKSNHINNTVGQMAAMIEKFDPTIYNKVLDEVATEYGFKEITKGSAEEFVARTSNKMQSAFFKMQMNTLTDNTIQKASIAPILRKANIGRISTPNFTVRNMVMGLQTKYVNAGDSVKADAMTEILHALSNMTSKKGGLFDDAEQKAIDTKHVWDAMTTSQVARYSTGVNMLYGKYAKVENQEKALTHIVSALYNNMFTKTQEVYSNRSEGIQAIVKEVMAHKGDMQYFKANKVADGHLKHGLVAMLQIQELDNSSLKDAQWFFNNELNQGRTFSENGIYMDKAVGELLEAFAEGKYKGQLTNTFYDEMANFAIGSISDRSLQVTADKGYLKIGSFKGDFEDYVYSLKDSGYNNRQGAYATFDVLKYSRKKGTFEPAKHSTITFNAVNNAKLNEKLQNQFYGVIDHNTSAIRNLTNDAMIAARKLDREKQAVMLTDIVVNKGSFASNNLITQNLDSLKKLESWHVDKLGRQQYENVIAMFGATAVDTQRITQRTSELGQVYEYAKAKGLVGTQNVQPNALIRSINENIASHPERYGTTNNGSFAMSKTFDKILEDKFIADGIFDSVDRIESIRKEMIAMNGFDTKTYNSAVETMRSNLYDVRSEINTLNAKYSQLAKDYGSTEVVTKAMQGRETAVSKFTQTLSAKNRTHIDAMEKQVYGLFKNRNQMETFFGLDKSIASGNTIVGFGEYMGHKFSDLSSGDIFRILSSASEYENASSEAKHAMERTTALLSEWNNTIGVPSPTSAMQYQEMPSDLLGSALKEVENIQEHAKIELDNLKQAADNVEDIVKDTVTENTSETMSKAASTAKEKTQKKTVTGELWAKGKKAIEDWGITGKHVGIAVAGMAALGIANNLLHNQKNDSPLTPVRRPNGNGSPSIDGNYPQHSSPSGDGIAPRSVGNRVVYHDQQSGMNFRVSAKTKQNINPRQQGANVGTMTGGSASVNVYQDNSGVTDNWLANKFAELS